VNKAYSPFSRLTSGRTVGVGVGCGVSVILVIGVLTILSGEVVLFMGNAFDLEQALRKVVNSKSMITWRYTIFLISFLYITRSLKCIVTKNSQTVIFY
jgi:hypothetical protein